MRSLGIAVVALALTGCIVHETKDSVGGPLEPGDITFLWNFDGQTCSQVRQEVYEMRVTLNGPRGPEQLDQDGIYNCNPAGTDGIRLVGFDGGTYTFNIEALDSGNFTVYTTTGTLTVNGDTTVPVTLHRTVRPSKLVVDWSFGGGLTCQSADLAQPDGVARVRITLNKGTPEEIACSAGTASIDLDPGTYIVQIDSLTDVPNALTGKLDTRIWYSASQSVNVVEGNSNSYSFLLAPVAGGATFVPSLLDAAGGPLTCATAGVRTLRIQLADYQGNTTPQYSCACDACPNGFLFAYLVANQTFDTATKLYRANWTVTVQADDGAVTPKVLFQGGSSVQVYAGEKAWDPVSQPQGQRFPVALHPL